MRSRLRSISPAVVIAAIAAAVVTGGFAMAAIPSRNGTITACANKKTGALRVVDADRRQKCRRTERRITWNQRGVPGAKGDPGAPGATGPKGDRGNDGAQGSAGTGLSTSDFYTKTEAEGRFLDNTETARNALRFGDRDEDQFVKGNVGSVRQSFTSVAAGEAGQVAPVTSPSGTSLGHVEASCADPATASSQRWRASAVAGPHVWVDDGGATPSFTTVDPGNATPVVSSGQADHITYTLFAGVLMTEVDLWVSNGLGGANTCTFVWRITHGQT